MKEKVTRITSFKKGESIFTSTGISRIKVTRNGDVECLEIPITSTGISDLIDTFDNKSPDPPFKDVKVTPDSDIGKDLGLTRNEWVRIQDLSDKDYIKAREKHNSDLGLAIALKGLAVDFMDEKQNPITDDDEKLKILKGMGLSSEQFTQIVEDINSLTKWRAGETARFLG